MASLRDLSDRQLDNEIAVRHAAMDARERERIAAKAFGRMDPEDERLLHSWAEAYNESDRRRIENSVGVFAFSAPLSQDGLPFMVEGDLVVGLVESHEEARSAGAAWIASHGLPASLGLVATSLSSAGRMWSFIRFQANLWPNGVNGGRNETGIRRYRGLVRKLETAGVPTTWAGTKYSNACPTRGQFEKLIA
jgi:hypothetical protein